MLIKFYKSEEKTKLGSHIKHKMLHTLFFFLKACIFLFSFHTKLSRLAGRIETFAVIITTNKFSFFSVKPSPSTISKKSALLPILAETTETSAKSHLSTRRNSKIEKNLSLLLVIRSSIIPSRHRLFILVKCKMSPIPVRSVTGFRRVAAFRNSILCIRRMSSIRLQSIIFYNSSLLTASPDVPVDFC